MGRRDLAENLFCDFEPLLKAEGLELLSVDVLSENRQTVLRTTIFKPEGVSLDDCTKAQRILADRLDEADPIPGSYNLEVSSPGLERTLKRDKEFALFRGRECRVNLFAPLDGRKNYEGLLVGLVVGEDGRAFVELDEPGGRIRIDRNLIGSVKLVYRWR